MTEKDFDKCPECGASPAFGLRCHPKFSLKVMTPHNLVALYAHDEETIRALAVRFEPDDILGLDCWDGDKWVELP